MGALRRRLRQQLLSGWSHLRQRRIYARLFAEKGGWSATQPHEVHHWGSRRGQTRRFEALAESLGPGLRGGTVADVGCGCGDFAAFLQEAGLVPREYVGYDIVPDFIDVAQQRFPPPADPADRQQFASFECRDIIWRPPPRQFDFVVSSGIFAFGNEAFFKQMTEAAFGLATQRYSFNLFEGSGYEQDFWTIPRYQAVAHLEGLGAAADGERNAVEVRHDYMPDDCTLTVARQPGG